MKQQVTRLLPKPRRSEKRYPYRGGGGGAIIGGTIDVSDDSLGGSCRSDLTHDLAPEDVQQRHPSPSTSGQQRSAPSATALERDVSELTFHTAGGAAGPMLPPNENGETKDDEGCNDSLTDAEDLDEMAERAARDCFGVDADRPEGPLRRSTLVSENATLDASWFAARGLMSRRSFERYQEEMKSKVIEGASSGTHLSGLAKSKTGSKGFRRASISMGDLRNLERPTARRKAQRRITDTNMPPPEILVPPKPKSVDEGLDQLASHDASLDQLVQGFVSSIKSGELTSTSLKSKLATTGDSDEIKALIRRLSKEETTPPYEADDFDEASIQGELLEGIVGRRESTGDLMDSDTWEPPRNVQEEDKEARLLVRRTSSTKTLKISNEAIESQLGKHSYRPRRNANGGSMEMQEKNPSSGKEDKSAYAPKRTSSLELKGIHVRQASSGNEDSFHITRFERSEIETLSSNMLSTTPRDDDSSSVLLSPPQQKPMLDSRVLSPGKKTFRREDTSDTMSTLSPNIPGDTASALSQLLDVNIVESTKGLTMPSLDRGHSTTSTTTLGAVASMGLVREDSLSTRCTMPTSQPSLPRGETFGTDQAVVDIDDRLQRIDRPSDNTSGASDLPHSKTSGVPSRRHSMSSSHSSVGDMSSLLKRRNSFNSISSLFTVPTASIDGPPLKEDCGDVLQEGMEYLSMAMLVNVYAKLRSLSILGHASVRFVDIDVNSHQSLARKKEMNRRLGLLEQKEDLPYLESTKTAGAIVRTVLDEYTMLEASSELSAGFRQAHHATMMYDASLLKEFKTWVEESKVKVLDDVTESLIKSLREECSKRQALLSERKSNDSLSTMEQADIRRSIARRRCSLIETSNSFEDATWFKQERKLIADHFGVGGRVSESRSACHERERSRRLSKGVLTESMIERTLDESHEFFEKGSSLRNLLESGLEVVWFADRHPEDVIYCICVNRETSTVTVVFRGQEGVFDLLKDSSMSSYSNPLAHEDYPGNSGSIGLRAAVSDEMMRVRRDTKKSTMDEIREKVQAIGTELTGGGEYHLSVAGHSLGGGLATVAGFFLASDPDLDLASAVRVFSFASPRVGCESFRMGFKHLEETGRLQHARFATSNEVVSLLPTSSAYHHVGMQIRLHKANRAGRQRARQSLDVAYDCNGSHFTEALQIVSNFCSTTKSSRISEYQHRMHFAREYRLALGEGVLRFDKRRNRLKSLNEYYLMKCRLVDYMGSTKQREPLLSFLVFFVVSCLISFELALILKFVATW